MIPVNEPAFTGAEKKLLNECIDTGWISADGSFVKKFEKQFAAYIGMKHGIAVCNGTAAIELALACLDLNPQDGIIVPTFTIISCVAGIIRAGLRPILVDADPETWCLNTDEVEKIVARDRNVKGIMPVHIYGHPCDMGPLFRLAENYDLMIVEDAAEAHGAQYNGHKCGSMGHVAAFSFYANKIVTTGEGGMCLTDDDALARRLRSFRNLCFGLKNRFVHQYLGFNFRMTNLQAAMGVAQMLAIDELVNNKVRQGLAYRRGLADLKGIRLQEIKGWASAIYWMNGIVLNDEIEVDARQFADRLHLKGIQTRPFFWPMHEQPVFKKMGLFAGERYPVAERLARRGLYLPSGMNLNDTQIETVIETVRNVLAQVRR